MPLMGEEALILSKKFTKEQIAIIEGKSDILGIYWDKTANTTLIRTGVAQGKVANVGVDGQFVQNDFDKLPIYREIGLVTDILGNQFTRIPKCYVRKKEGVDFLSIEISKKKYPGFYLPYLFWDFVNEKELEYYDHGSHKGSLSPDNKLESKPGLPPLVSRNIVDFRNFAQNNNVNGLKGYQLLDIHAIDLLQCLFYVEFATLNSQAVGAGFTTGEYANETHLSTVAETATNRIIVANAVADSYRVKQPISIGTNRYGTDICYSRSIVSIDVYDATNKAITFDGSPVDIAIGNFLSNTGWVSGFNKDIAASSGSLVSNTDGKYPFVYRGIESPWGDLLQFVDGINITDNQAWVCNNADEYASNVFTAPYEKLSYLNSNINGWVSEMGFDSNHPFAQFPIAVAGGSSSYYSDYYYQNSGQRIALFGAAWSDGSPSGLSSWNLSSSSSYALWYIGGRLLKKAL